MQTYTLKITPWRDGSCSRTIEFLASQSLGDVHAAIQHEFDLDDDHLWPDQQPRLGEPVVTQDLQPYEGCASSFFQRGSLGPSPKS